MSEQRPHRKQAALWQIGLGFLMYMMVIRLAFYVGRSSGRGAMILVLLGGLAVLGLAAMRWGSDSREGKFWRDDSNDTGLRL